MIIKALAMLFLLLTIINIPVFAFYLSGNKVQQTESAGTFKEWFAQPSLGNIGQQENACGESNIAIEAVNDMILSCSFGVLGSL